MVRDDFVVETKAEVHFMKKECGNAFGHNILFCGTENYSLSKSMVDHDQKGIKTGGDGEISDEVAGDLLERVGGRGANGGEWGNSGMGVGLILLAGCATFDVFMDIGGKTGPPEFGCNELLGFQIAGVTGTFMVMAMLENSMPEGIVIGDVDATLVGQDACFNLPVREAGAKRKGNIFVHRLKGLKYKGIAGRGRFDAMGQRNVDDIDKEGWREESDVIVVVIGVRKEVRTSGEGVRTSKEFPGNVDHFQVEVSEVDEPTGLSSVEMLGGAEVGEVLMACEDLYREGRSVKVVPP